MTGSPLTQGGPRVVVAALALIFALAHVPFLATSLEDIDSVNFALGVRYFDVAQHRPHPPGYPVYIALGKAAKAIAGFGVDASESVLEAKSLAVLSLLAGLAAIACLYVVFACLNGRNPRELDVAALSAVAITATCPLYWYLAARPMSDLPGLAVATASQACLLVAWWRQTPRSNGDRRLPPAEMAASGRMIVVGAFLAAISIGLRSQALWITVPLLLTVLADRIGRGAAGATIGGGIMFVVGGLLWGIPMLVASGGLNTYLAALGSQAGEDFAGVDMLYLNPTPRTLAFAVLRTFVFPWDSPVLASIVLVLAAFGVVQLLLRDRRSLVALAALAAPYLAFHLAFQDTSFVRYALPLVPAVAFLAVRGVMLVPSAPVAGVAAAVSIGGVMVAGPVLVTYASQPSPTVRALSAMKAESRTSAPGALAMHQTFVRPLEAEEVGITPQLASPPRLEWLEVEKYWKAGHTEPIWFLGDPMRSDLALIDPVSRRDVTPFDWSIAARPAFGGLRPAAARWYRMPLPGWYAEDGWSLTPETSGIAKLRGRGPHLGPITAMVRRRPEAVTIMVGGRNLGARSDPAAHFVMAIDSQPVDAWDAEPGFFLRFVDVPAGRLAGSGFATLSLQSAAVPDGRVIPTAIEQFDLQNTGALIWGYGDGWQEAEFSQALGVWRWTSERATLRVAGGAGDVRITMRIESPLRYFDEAPLVRVRAGDREVATATIGSDREWTFDVPREALAASSGAITIETDKTFVPAGRGGAADERHLGLRVFGISVANSLTAAEKPR